MVRMTAFSMVSFFLATASLSAMEEPREEFDVAVIGSGLSGLRAAREIKQETENFKVFEGRDRPGGRACTQTIGEKFVDCGGEFINSDHHEMKKLLKEYKLKTTGVVFENEKTVALSEMRSTLEELKKKLEKKSKSINNDDYYTIQNIKWVTTSLFDSLNLSKEEAQLLNAIIRDEEGIVSPLKVRAA
jgi:monoamine oxidase